MLTYLRNIFYSTGAAFTVGMIATKSALAQGTVSAGTSGGNNFNEIAENIVDSISDLPGLLTALSYLAGVLFGVLGILKIKDHVEDPNSAPLKDGAVKLAAGGALFALPIIYEAMFNTIGDGQEVSAAQLQAVDFAVE